MWSYPTRYTFPLCHKRHIYIFGFVHEEERLRATDNSDSSQICKEIAVRTTPRVLKISPARACTMTGIVEEDLQGAQE